MTRIFVAAIIALCALAPSVGSAEHIPGNVSQRQKLMYASANWTLDEPDGSFLRFGIDTARGRIQAGNLVDRVSGTCLNVFRLDAGELPWSRRRLL